MRLAVEIPRSGKPSVKGGTGTRLGREEAMDVFQKTTTYIPVLVSRNAAIGQRRNE